jgi:hypothetical protein
MKGYMYISGRYTGEDEDSGYWFPWPGIWVDSDGVEFAVGYPAQPDRNHTDIYHPIVTNLQTGWVRIMHFSSFRVLGLSVKETIPLDILTLKDMIRKELWGN